MTAAGQTDAAEPAAEAGGAGQERPVVLVVDDETSMLDSCTQVLERDGMEVLCAEDGFSALDLVGERRPDVMIVDLRMAGMSGEELLLEARQIDSEMVAVAITGYPTLSSAVDAMRAGAYDLLPKPFKAEELRLAVSRALERRRLAVEAAEGEREKRLMQDNFVAMVSHQLKAPAATAKECLDAAMGSFADKMPERCRDLIERASRKTGLLLHLMSDWLTLARVESGDMTAGSETLELCKVIEAALTDAQERHHGADVAVRFEGGVCPIGIAGDAEALHELFFNLVDNALTYTPGGGSAMVEVTTEGHWAVVRVTDTGPGSPLQEQALVFEPFFRGEATKKREGTGLGLPIAKQIAEAHGGQIVLTSEAGQGTTFKVLLPGTQQVAGTEH